MKSHDLQKSNQRLGLEPVATPDGDSVMNDASDSSSNTALGRMRGLLEQFHDDESGVAMTEYIIVFTLLSFGAMIALLTVTVYIKAYRHFLVWWLGHPLV